jgi:hypothetical protein
MLMVDTEDMAVVERIVEQEVMPYLHPQRRPQGLVHTRMPLVILEVEAAGLFTVAAVVRLVLVVVQQAHQQVLEQAITVCM